MRLKMLLLFLFWPSLLAAQLTQVSGTVTDPTGLRYSNGTINATLIISGTPFLSGFPYTPPSQPTGLDANGHFVMSLGDVTQILPSGGTWSFHVCSASGTVQPGSPITNGPVCFDTVGLIISGASQDISTPLSTAAPRLTSPASGGSGTPGAPVNSVQVNVAGAFAGFAQHQYSNSAFGVTGTPAISLRSDGAAPSNAMIDMFANPTLGATPATAINLNFVPTLVASSNWSEIRFGDPTSTSTGINVAWSIGSTASITAPSEWGIYMNPATPANLSHRVAGRLGVNTSVSSPTGATAEVDALTGLVALRVVGDNTGTGNFNIFTGIEGFGSHQALQVDGGGHIGSQNNVVVVSGTGCTIQGNSNDSFGYILLSAGATTCTVTFGNTHFSTGAQPICVVGSGATGQNLFIPALPTTTSFQFTSAAATGNVYYHCFWEK